MLQEETHSGISASAEWKSVRCRRVLTFQFFLPPDRFAPQMRGLRLKKSGAGDLFRDSRPDAWGIEMTAGI
jgi:hypothetical protein